ncbi:hypothetical protein HKX48_009575 [Thoreauomyces humboldtii]|nr:hypothetical protein HKX48_009575 [Thoreauomyces humboldtii]
MTIPTLPTIPTGNVIPLEAGSIICGIVLCLALQSLSAHGMSYKVVGDADRQKFLNTLCLIVVVAGIISLGLNQTGQYFQLQDVCVLIIFWGVQLGLCTTNHNTIVRSYLAFAKNTGYVRRISTWCLALYPLSIVILTPLFVAFNTTVTEEKGINSSKINTQVFKPLNVALVFATELLASGSDILLLRRILAGNVDSEAKEIIKRNLLKQYAVVWGSVVLDILLKLLIFAGQPVLFDSQVSNLTLVLRAATNLKYGLTIKDVFDARKPKLSATVLSSTKFDSVSRTRAGSVAGPEPKTSRSIEPLAVLDEDGEGVQEVEVAGGEHC